MIIENKVWTTEHSDKLDRYYQFVKKNQPRWHVLGIYLTPHGDTPSHKAYSSVGGGPPSLAKKHGTGPHRFRAHGVKDALRTPCSLATKLTETLQPQAILGASRRHGRQDYGRRIICIRRCGPGGGRALPSRAYSLKSGTEVSPLATLQEAVNRGARHSWRLVGIAQDPTGQGVLIVWDPSVASPGPS